MVILMLLLIQKRVQDKMLQEKGMSFVVHTGDFAYDNPWSQGRWDDWGRLLEPLMSSTPYVAVVGNHEWNCLDAFDNFKNRFTQVIGRNSRGNGAFWYSFAYSNVYIIVVSSEHPLGTSSEQYRWIESTLQQVDRQRYQWLIVSYHRPMYSTTRGRYPGDSVVRNIEPLLIRFSVDLVLSGHEHNIERICQITNSVCGRGPAHITIGTGGRYLYEDFHNPQPVWSVFREAVFGYSKIDVTRTTLSWKFIRVNGTIADSLILRK